MLVDELPPGAAARNAAGWDECLDRLVGVAPAPDAWNPASRSTRRHSSRLSVPRKAHPPSTRADSKE
ncbi:hypothetical protein ACQPZ2_35620 [Nocardia pseudovaccinii]|uniref:hypothetical protein n=1 Tax=Nocardia pseudovaccinii TaxID=189540 RepID=UPI003D8D65D5